MSIFGGPIESDILSTYLPLDPYHTYLSLAALSMYPPGPGSIGTGRESWDFEPLDPLLNARKETSLWAREHIPDPKNRPVAESA